MITCPRCGYQAPDGSPYCPRCGYGRQPVPPQQPGAPMPVNMITCPKCGLKLPPGSRFCNRCGYKFSDKTKVTKEGLHFGSCILIALITIAAFIIIMNIGANIYKIIAPSDKTPTMSANQIMAAAQKTSDVLRTETAVASIRPTRTPEPTETEEPTISPEEIQTIEAFRLTPTSTQQAVSYCNNILLVWKSDADYLRAPGTLSFDSFDHQLPESCRYVLSGNSHDGRMIMYLDDEGIPYVTDFTMDVSDPTDQDALIGWVSAVASYLDMGTPTTIRRNLIDVLDTGTLMLKSNAITIDRDGDPLWKVEITRQY